jgi:hypothetical protein
LDAAEFAHQLYLNAFQEREKIRWAQEWQSESMQAAEFYITVQPKKYLPAVISALKASIELFALTHDKSYAEKCFSIYGKIPSSFRNRHSTEASNCFSRLGDTFMQVCSKPLQTKHQKLVWANRAREVYLASAIRTEEQDPKHSHLSYLNAANATLEACQISLNRDNATQAVIFYSNAMNYFNSHPEAAAGVNTGNIIKNKKLLSKMMHPT